MNGRVIVVAAAVVLVAAGSSELRAQPKTLLMPARVARLQAAGLDPGDPQLRAKLAALAKRRLQVYRLPRRDFSLAALQRSYLTASKPVGVIKIAGGGPIVFGNGAASQPTITSVAGRLMDWPAISGQNLSGKSVSVVITVAGCPNPMTTGEYEGTATEIIFQTPTTGFDGAPRSATLQAVVDGRKSNTIPATYTGWVTNWNPQSIVAADLPHLSNNDGMSLTEGTTVLYSTPGPRISTDPFAAQGGKGEDILGRGVFVLNGWTASAKILSAESYMDAPNYAAPADANRGATITVAPQNGRLETHVSWFYNPGESISYAVQWTFIGPLGPRPLSTMPMQNPACVPER